MLQAAARQLFPLQCPNCQQVNSVTIKPYRDILLYSLIIQRIFYNKAYRNLLIYGQALIYALALFSFSIRILGRRSHLDIVPQNPLEWLGILLLSLNIGYLAWNGIRNGVVSGYKYSCLNCKYAWLQIKPDHKGLAKKFKAATREAHQARRIGNNKERAAALQGLAVYTGLFTQDVVKAVNLAQESVQFAEASNDTRIFAFCYSVWGALLLDVKEVAQATLVLQQSLGLAGSNRYWDLYTIVANSLGTALLHQDYYEPARQYFEESLVYRLKMGGIETEGIVVNLEGLAGVALGYGFPVRSVRLAGAATTRRTTIGFPLTHIEQQYFDQMLEKARTQLGQSNFEKAWAEGLAMPLVPAVHYALSNQP
jgi:hypothetical protein